MTETDETAPALGSAEADGRAWGRGPVQAEEDGVGAPSGETSIAISEVFGPTFQGEGRSTGRYAAFVRLGRCNLACTWCDTPYTWDWERHDPAVELDELSVGEVVARIDAMRPAPGTVVVTGGEPMLQQSRLQPLVEALRARGARIEVETAGTIAPDRGLAALVDQWNVSPKLANSGNPETRRLKLDVLRAFDGTDRATFKFVIVDEADLDEVAAIVEAAGLREVWVMPEGTEPGELLSRSRSLAPAVLERGWNLTTRLHVLLWGDRRGV